MIRNSVFAFAVGVLGSVHAAPIALPSTGNTWIEGVSFKAGTTIEVNPPEAFPSKGTLADTFNYGVGTSGITLKGGTEVTFFANKTPRLGTVFAGQYGNIPIKPDSGIFFHFNGNPQSFLPTADIQIGNDGAGNYKIPIQGGKTVSTHLNGSIASAMSTGEFLYAIPGSPISFYFGPGTVMLEPSDKPMNQSGFILGAIRQATLSRNHITSSQPFEVILAGSEITIDGRGNIRRISHTAPFNFRNGVLTAGGTVEIGVDNTARIFTFGNFTYLGKNYSAGRTIILTNGLVQADF